jgi:hypothetical protein
MGDNSRNYLHLHLRPFYRVSGLLFDFHLFRLNKTHELLSIDETGQATSSLRTLLL